MSCCLVLLNESFGFVRIYLALDNENVEALGGMVVGYLVMKTTWQKKNKYRKYT